VESQQAEKPVVEEKNLAPNLPEEDHVQDKEEIISIVQGDSNECNDPNFQACQELAALMEHCNSFPRASLDVPISHKEFHETK
ncbi:hypothetical protein KI387_040570, partial [Taxus chinensis]